MRSDEEILKDVWNGVSDSTRMIGPEQVQIRRENAMLELLMDIRALLAPLETKKRLDEGEKS